MAYSLFCDFYVNNEHKLTIEFDELKNINERKYAASLICKEIDTDITIPKGLSEYNSYQWFDINSFVELRNNLQKDYEKALCKKTEIEFNRKAVPFHYQLDSYKQDIIDEIEDCEEIIEYCVYGISSCEKMIGIISILESGDYGKNYEELCDKDYKKSDVKVLVYSN